MHGSTPNYGISNETDKYVISRFEQEEMDRKIGYIDDKYIYIGYN